MCHEFVDDMVIVIDGFLFAYPIRHKTNRKISGALVLCQPSAERHEVITAISVDGHSVYQVERISSTPMTTCQVGQVRSKSPEETVRATVSRLSDGRTIKG